MGEKLQVSVTTHEVIELDADRVEEWVDANAPQEGRIQIQDLESGDILYSNL